MCILTQDKQGGKERAAYGKQVLEQLSKKIEERFGEGWSVETLKRCRKFYSMYFPPPQIGSTVLTELGIEYSATNFGNNAAEIQTSSTEPHKFVLSWSHYLILMRIKDANARSFYEIECAKQNWSIRWLQRQVNSSLYERLALSKDKMKSCDWQLNTLFIFRTRRNCRTNCNSGFRNLTKKKIYKQHSHSAEWLL